jgi:hypothetical protein
LLDALDLLPCDMIEQEVKEILDSVLTWPAERQAEVARMIELMEARPASVSDQSRGARNLGSRVASRFAKTGLTTDLPELRAQLAISRKTAKPL